MCEINIRIYLNFFSALATDCCFLIDISCVFIQIISTEMMRIPLKCTSKFGASIFANFAYRPSVYVKIVDISEHFTLHYPSVSMSKER